MILIPGFLHPTAMTLRWIKARDGARRPAKLMVRGTFRLMTTIPRQDIADRMKRVSSIAPNT
ncbi:hypothetical protein CEG18_23525 [Pseudomonas nitroreducens]|uniref:Uncharacterized protein n=1 Tax=Pseudomonas nitroreducens TaxID=46680 RepID=A0A246F7S8_PSENT|nr:hypothetical protein CEG18_23525 [Pseudomonas nitroreducens]